MEDPSIIPSDSFRLRADAEPFVPKYILEVPKKIVEMPKKVVDMSKKVEEMPKKVEYSVRHISMRQQIAFRDFTMLLQSLYMCKKDTGQIDRAFLLISIFADLFTKETIATITHMLGQIQYASMVICESQMKGSSNYMMHVCQFTMLVQELYGLVTRLETIVF